MRHSGASSELARLAAPLSRLLDGAWRRMHWWIVAMALLYAVSGVTVIQPDEVALVERWGRLVGETPATQQHGPGILFAFPRPIDEVIRVRTRWVREVEVRTLVPRASGEFAENSLDPLTVGYALTGDHNIVHVGMIARYRVRDPADWAFHGVRAEQSLLPEVTAAMVRSLGELAVDRVLAEERKDLIKTVTARAQAGLDAVRSGVELVSLELTRLTPPQALSPDFEAVQTAYIGAETQRKEALSFAENEVPRAHAEANRQVEETRAYAATELAWANGETAAFTALAREARTSPDVVRTRLYRDAVERAIGAAGSVRWVPAPVRGTHASLRVLVAPQRAGPATRSAPRSEAPPPVLPFESLGSGPQSESPPGDED